MNTPTRSDNERCHLLRISQRTRSLTSMSTSLKLTRSNARRTAGPTPPGPMPRVTATARKFQRAIFGFSFRFAVLSSNSST